MYPFFEVFSGFYIYTFGLTLTICFFLFLWMLKRLSQRFGINETFFINRLLWYFLSIFIFSRLFYVIANWNEYKHIKNSVEFFIMSDYNFSIIGAIFGFLVVLFTQFFLHKIPSGKYIDVTVLSFLFVSIIGYLGAFLGGQVYGRQTNFGIEIIYNNPFSPVPFEVPIFPLALLYSLVFFLIFSFLYITIMFVKVRGIIGNIGFIFIGASFILLEFLNGKSDFFKILFGINLTQVGGFFLIILGFYGLYVIFQNTGKNKEII